MLAQHLLRTIPFNKQPQDLHKRGRSAAVSDRTPREQTPLIPGYDQPGRLRRSLQSDGTSRPTLCPPNGVKPNRAQPLQLRGPTTHRTSPTNKRGPRRPTYSQTPPRRRRPQSHAARSSQLAAPHRQTPTSGVDIEASMGFCDNTSQRAPICRGTLKVIWHGSNSNSTTDHEPSPKTEHPPTSSHGC